MDQSNQLDTDFDLQEVFRFLYENGNSDGSLKSQGHDGATDGNVGAGLGGDWLWGSGWDDDDDEAEGSSRLGKVQSNEPHPPMHHLVPVITSHEPVANQVSPASSTIFSAAQKRVERAFAKFLQNITDEEESARKRKEVGGEGGDGEGRNTKRRRNARGDGRSRDHAPQHATSSGNSISSALADPTSVSAYHARLLTYKLSTYSPKPGALNAANVSRYGWTNGPAGVEEGLECLECGVQWDLKATTDRLNLRGLDKDGGGKLSNELKDRLIRLLADQLSLAHRLTCIWRKHHTPRNVTRWLLAKHPQNSVQLSPIAMNINKRFFELAPDQVVENGVVEVVHPLSPTQLANLMQNLIMTQVRHITTAHQDSPEPPIFSPISEKAAVIAFFGWVPLTGLHNSKSIGKDLQAPESTTNNSDINPDSAKTDDILHCRLCDRKVGLWNFRWREDQPEPHRAMDVVYEHRDFCPLRREDPVVWKITGKWWDECVLVKDSAVALTEKTSQEEQVAMAKALIQHMVGEGGGETEEEGRGL